MIKFIGNESINIKKSFERYLCQLKKNFFEKSFFIYLINVNWTETRKIICHYRKNEIEASKSEIISLTPIVIFSLSDIKINSGVNNLYHFIKLTDLNSVTSLQFRQIELKKRHAQILWQEFCTDYLRKIIHDLRGKDIKLRDLELYKLEMILTKNEIEKIRSELK